jgi:hypothetical protein
MAPSVSGTIAGGSAHTKESGSPWPAIALTVAVVVALVEGAWLASSAGLVGGTTKPAADRSIDASRAAYLDSILDGAHAAPFVGAVTPSVNASRAAYLDSILDGAHAAPFAVAVRPSIDASRTAYLDRILDGAHAAPFAGGE